MTVIKWGEGRNFKNDPYLQGGNTSLTHKNIKEDFSNRNTMKKQT